MILSAGAIASPAILQRSGIGPAGLLKKHGIEIIADRPGVGANLQDHLEVYFQIACRQPVSLYKYLNPLSKALIGARITNGNLNAPSIMTGEKADDHIKGNNVLPRANDAPFFHARWQTAQR